MIFLKLTRWLMVCIVILGLTSCSEDDSSGNNPNPEPNAELNITNESNTTESNEDIKLEDLDFTLRTVCPSYHNGLGTWNDHNGKQPDRIEAYLVNNSGQNSNLFHRYESFSITVNWGSAVRTHPVDDEKRELIRSNVDKNVLVKCIYKRDPSGEEQIFNMFIPLKLRSAWKKTYSQNGNDIKDRNNLYFEASFLSDLFYKIYLKNYADSGNQDISLEKTRDFMNKKFPNAIFEETNYVNYEGQEGSGIRGKETQQGKYYQSLRMLALEYTSDQVDLLNELIAQNYDSYYLAGNHTCMDKAICARFFDDYTYPVINDSNFTQGTLEWNMYEELYGDATGGINQSLVSVSPRKYNISLSLSSDHSGDISPSQISLDQRYAIQNDDDLDNLFFTINSKSAEGGCNAMGGCLASGMAGYYACFKDIDNKQMGCILFSTYTDSITLPIAIGNVLDFHSTNEIANFPLPETLFGHMIDLGKVIESSLPSVRNNREAVTHVEVGAFVGEVLGSGGYCNKCFANLEAVELSLELIREN